MAFQTDTKQGSNRMSFLPAKVKAAKLNAASVVANASKTSKGVSHPITKNPEKTQKNPEGTLASKNLFNSAPDFVRKIVEVAILQGQKRHISNQKSTKANWIIQ